MIRMHLSEAATVVGGAVSGGDPVIHGCTHDTRTLQGGELFVALRGNRVDGHDLLDAARGAGAEAAMVERRAPGGLPLLLVDDARRAMGRLAGAWRRRFDPATVAVTGSNGKTTVKEMLAAILGTGGEVLATRGNLNNDIGVPLTLFELDAGHASAVIEMGANHPGEIAALAYMAAPSVAVVTQCAPAHLEGFGSAQGVARAKAEIYEALDGDGIAVINADDPFAALFRERAGARRVLSFAMQAPADVRARDLGPGSAPASRGAAITTPAGAFEVELALAGRHNVMNAAAASACAHALGFGPEACRAGLARVRPVRGRLQPREGPRGSRIIDDTYNANPGSLQAALGVLAEGPGTRWLVLGDMGELGAEAERYHAEAGEAARAAGVERLFTLGSLSRAAGECFGAGARHFEAREELIETLRAELDEAVVVLVKGSRAMQLDALVEALTAQGDGAC